MADLIQNFRNEVAKLLNCDHAAKERLLASFDKNIAAPFMEANEEANPEVLHATLGTPQTVANVLMEQLTEEEKLRYQKQKKLRKGILIGVSIAAATAILTLAIHAFYFKDFSNITYIDHGVTEIGTYIVN